jgi:hypothetical protein
VPRMPCYLLSDAFHSWLPDRPHCWLPDTATRANHLQQQGMWVGGASLTKNWVLRKWEPMPTMASGCRSDKATVMVLVRC